MKKKEEEFNKIELTGWVLFILLMIPFVLLLMAEPSFDNDCHPYVWEKALVCTWLGSLVFSVLLIVVGKYIK
jgi:hypothetical protein